jgi:pimeloyl-ACP methyl ester carboxylesterase
MCTVLRCAALALIALLVGLLAIGFGYERLMAAGDARSFPAPGQMLSVDGYAMHLNCAGEGSPTVVMDAGLGGWSMDWTEVQPSVARSTRVCTYDRPGMGWSSPRPEPQDAQHAVAELRNLLISANIDGPLVLVGHSHGGLRMLLYAAEYRADVVGLVLVDPTPISTDEEQFAALSPTEQADLLSLSGALQSEPTAGSQLLVGLIQAAQPFGVARLLSDSLLAGTIYPHLSSQLQPAYRAGVNRPSFMLTIAAEAQQRLASIGEVRRMGALDDLPMVVLASSDAAAFYGDPLSIGVSGRAQRSLHPVRSSGCRDLVHRSYADLRQVIQARVVRGCGSVQVLIVDDQAPFRRAAARVLARLPDFHLIGEVETGEASVEAGRRALAQDGPECRCRAAVAIRCARVSSWAARARRGLPRVPS